MHTREQELQIGDLAFQLWEQQGFPHGHDVELRCEAEIRLGLAQQASSISRSPPGPSAPHR